MFTVTPADEKWLEWQGSIANQERKVAELTDQFNRSRDARRRGWYATTIEREQDTLRMMRFAADSQIEAARQNAAAADQAIMDALADLAADTLRCDDPDCGCQETPDA